MKFLKTLFNAIVGQWLAIKTRYRMRRLFAPRIPKEHAAIAARVMVAMHDNERFNAMCGQFTRTTPFDDTCQVMAGDVAGRCDDWADRAARSFLQQGAPHESRSTNNVADPNA